MFDAILKFFFKPKSDGNTVYLADGEVFDLIAAQIASCNKTREFYLGSELTRNLT